MNNLTRKLVSITLLMMGTLCLVWVASSLSGGASAQNPPAPTMDDPTTIMNAVNNAKSGETVNVKPGGPKNPGPPQAPNAPPPQPPPAAQTMPPPPPGDQPPMVEETTNTSNKIPGFVPVEGYTYDPTGLRDPFKPWSEPVDRNAPPSLADVDPKTLEPLQNFELAQLKLIGIVWGIQNPKAMIKDPTGKLHVIKKNTKIGRKNGFVATIREGEVVIVEPVRDGNTVTASARVMLLTRE